jgi:LacI family transcriptional regulator
MAESYMLGRIEGIIMHGNDHDRAAALASQGMPTLVLAASLNLPPGCSSVYTDEHQTVQLAMQHLWDLGHRRIAHIAGPIAEQAQSELDQEISWRQPRYDDVALLRHNGYVAWMQTKDLYDPELIMNAESWSAPHAENYISRFRSMENPPTAVFCANDIQAVDMIEAAHKSGIRIPENLSIVGVDDSHAARDCRPALTSVVVPVQEMGRQGFRTMLNMVTDNLPHEYRVKVPVSDLALRASTTTAPGVRLYDGKC